MKIETFHAADMRAALAQARAVLGEDAVIVRSRSTELGCEVAAAAGDALDALRARIACRELPRQRGQRPYVVALVGPAGAGKTTTLMKLALNPRAFGDRKVGIITLDTYKVGAIEEMALYAELVDVRVEVVFQQADLLPALQRFGDQDVVLIDTPGRVQGEEVEWAPMLAQARPDEVHLAIPAGLRLDVAISVQRAFAACRPTHQLLTRLDELNEDAGLAELAENIALPARWVSSGREVPTQLQPATARILASCGVSARYDGRAA